MNTLVENPIAIVVVLGLIVVYIGTYLLNKRTPVPEECKEIFDNASCNACNNFTCSHSHKG